jgi:hypothetical protein
MTQKTIEYIENEMYTNYQVYKDRIDKYSHNNLDLFEEVGGYLLNCMIKDTDDFIEEAWKFVNNKGEFCDETNETLHIIIRAFRILKLNGLLDLYLYNESDSWEPIPVIKYNLLSQMDSRSIQTYNDFDETITIYRGTSIQEGNSNPNDSGQSWTINIDKARYFAYSLNQDKDKVKIRVVLECKIQKKHIYAFSHHQGEDLCIINPNEIIDKSFKILEQKDLNT